MPGRTIEVMIDVAAPADAIFDYVADVPRHVEWNEQPLEITPLTPGPVAVGSRFSTREGLPSNLPPLQRLLMRPMLKVGNWLFASDGRTEAEVTELDPKRRIAWSAHLPSRRRGDLMRMRWSIDLEPNGPATRVTQRAEIDPLPTSPYSGMVDDSMVKSVRDGVEANLGRLKTIVEGQAQE